LKGVARHIAPIILLALIAWISSCKPKHICPAYQSSFYLDHKMADLEFSPFDKDTLPKMEELVKKTDVLLVLRLGKKKVEKRMSIIPMITIYPEPDSLLAKSDSLGNDSLAVGDEPVPEEGEEGAVVDSTAADEEAPSDEVKPDEEDESPVNEEEPTEENPEDEAIPKPKPKEIKPLKKTDLKDPELSDPGLKIEFDESFDDSLSEEDINAPSTAVEEPPIPRKESKRKPAKKGDADKPKEPEPETQPEDKF
jgi:hypothetical protein